MLQITKKDKIFIIAALPVAVALCYWFFLRKPLAAELSACEMQDVSLACAEQYEAENAMLNRQLAAARERLQNERNASETSGGSAGKTQASPAQRLEKVLKIFAEKNIRITKSEENANAGEKPSKAIMRTSFGIEEPLCRTFTAEGFYPDFVAALNAFSARENQIIVDSVSMTSRRVGCRWTVSVWF